MLTINNTLDGYLKDVEIKGNTIQDENNLADIRSVGEKVEGQELYEIPVLSCGKNLFDGQLEFGTLDSSNGNLVDSTAAFRNKNKFIKVKNGSNIIFAHISALIVIIEYDKNFQYIKSQTGQSFTLSLNTRYINFRTADTTSNYSQLQLEEGTVATEYEPYVEDKITILSPTPLEKVGDVADRLICKDGVWGVEKNVETKVLNGSESWNASSWTTSTTLTFEYRDVDIKKFIGEDIQVLSDKFVGLPRTSVSITTDTEYISTSGSLKIFINILKSKLPTEDVAGLKSWLKTNPMLIKYQTAQTQFIPLPHDQQIKLRTFANKTNISFLTEIEGTIKAQVPKSLGATVNAHTEQISNLNKELDRVKKLEESTVSTVETESDFTTVEATSNGYFEDVKLEGKTLVNLAKTNGLNVNQNFIDGRFSLHFGNAPYIDLYSSEITNISPNSIYTITSNVSTICGEMGIGILVNNGTNTNEFVWGKKTPYSFTIPQDAKSINLRIRTLNNEAINGTFNNICVSILEGDHTQNPPSYFEGLKSVGQDVDEIVVESVNENLFSGNILSGRYDETGNFVNDNRMYATSKFKIQANKTIVVNHNDINTVWMNFWDVNMNHISQVPIHPYNNIITPINCVMCSITGSIGATLNNLQIEYGTIATPYTPHQSDKKRLLYYNNETQTWEKPVLREWDSIEKHSDGKYYYHQRSGEVVLNGSENWQYPTGQDGNNTILLYSHISDAKINQNYPICDRFNGTYLNIWEPTTDIEGILINHNKDCILRLNKSKLSTQDIQGFKQWLQANNVTVVYQLAEEKVYECTNIDLITYANETNYIVESGAIVPRSTLKVHNNISNVVSLLQKKVSILDDKVTGILINAQIAEDETSIVGNKLNLTTDKYQVTNMVNNTQIVLPAVDKFTEIHLFFDTTSDMTLVYPSVKWQTVPTIKANASYEFIFTYVNDAWLGGFIVRK